MFDLAAIQTAIRAQNLDGWLMYDFRGSNILARRILQFVDGSMGSRRWMYFIPATGTPRKLVHRIESGALDHLPGDKTIYLKWQEFEAGVAKSAELRDEVTKNPVAKKIYDQAVVLEGMVRINSFSGERIAEGGSGCILGEISLLDDKPRSATVVSVGKSQVAVISSSSFWKLMDDDPAAAKTVLSNLGRVLCMRLRGANIQLDTLVGKG